MASDDPTLPPQTKIYTVEEEQQRLAEGLRNHPDPVVRLVAHMSERQLSFHELLSDFKQEVKEALTSMSGKIDQLVQDKEALEGRTDTLERQLSLFPSGNGASH